MKLKNVILVMHGWGSVIGFDYAMKHQDNIKGLAFLESYLQPPLETGMVSLLLQERHLVTKQDDKGYNAIVKNNDYFNKFFLLGFIKKPSDKALEYYHMPFTEPGSRKVIWQYLQDLPMGEKTPVLDLIVNFVEKLQHSPIPKLMLYSMPGFKTPMSSVKWARDNLPNITVDEIHDSLHYAPETRPVEVANLLSEWLKKNL